jgi:hypothetical protein
MKRLVVMACAVMTMCSFTACKKSNSQLFIVGTWELIQRSGGFAPTIAFPPGNGNQLKFTGSTYQQFTNGQLTKSGTYRLEKQTYNTGDPVGQPPTATIDIIFYDNEQNGHKLKKEGNTLIHDYTADAYDGITTVYKKL